MSMLPLFCSVNWDCIMMALADMRRNWRRLQHYLCLMMTMRHLRASWPRLLDVIFGHNCSISHTTPVRPSPNVCSTEMTLEVGRQEKDTEWGFMDAELRGKRLVGGEGSLYWNQLQLSSHLKTAWIHFLFLSIHPLQLVCSLCLSIGVSCIPFEFFRFKVDSGKRTCR